MDTQDNNYRPIVFISHSSKDKAFVRKLDATLTANSVSVFLDERDIVVGESIPKRIYESIGRATHVIYVISHHSLQSKWVQEEIDAAKMRQNRGEGCEVLPVKIDDCTLPPIIGHIKYADFRDWEDNKSFVRSFRQILLALRIELKIPGTDEFQFFLLHHDTFALAERTAWILGGLMDGARDADYALSGRDELQPGGGLWCAFKWNILEEDSQMEILFQVYKLLRTYESCNNGILKNILDPLSDLVSSIQNFDKKLISEDDLYSRRFRDTFYRVAGVIRELRMEVASVLMAGMQLGNSTK